MPNVNIEFRAIDNASDDIKRIQKRIDTLAKSKTLKVKVKAPDLEKVKRSIGSIRDRTVKVSVAYGKVTGLSTLKKDLNTFTSKAHRVKLKAEIKGLKSIKKQVDKLVKPKTLTINAKFTGLSGVKQSIASIPKTSTHTVQVRTVGGGGVASAAAPSAVTAAPARGGAVARTARGGGGGFGGGSGRLGYALGHALYGIPGPAGTLGASAAMVGGPAIPAALGIGAFAGVGIAGGVFEQKMDRVQAASRATKEEMVGLNREALNIGRTTQFSAREAGIAMEVLARNGVKARDIMRGSAKAVTDISIATAVGDQGAADNLEDAADIVTDAMVQFGLGAEELSKAGDLITAFTITSKGKLNDFYYFLSNAGPTFSLDKKGLGAFQEFVTAAAASMPYFHTGRRAGTAMKTFIQRLQAPSDTVRKLIEEDAMLTPLRKEGGGLAWYDANENLKTLPEIAELLKGVFGQMTEEDRGFYFTKIFGAEASKFAANLMAGGRERLEVTRAAIEPITSAQVADTKLDNLVGQFDILIGKAETAAIQLGNLTGATETLRGWVDNLNISLDKFISWIDARIEQREEQKRLLESAEGKLADKTPPPGGVGMSMTEKELTALLRHRLAQKTEIDKDVLPPGLKHIARIPGVDKYMNVVRNAMLDWYMQSPDYTLDPKVIDMLDKPELLRTDISDWFIYKPGIDKQAELNYQERLVENLSGTFENMGIKNPEGFLRTLLGIDKDAVTLGALGYELPAPVGWGDVERLTPDTPVGNPRWTPYPGRPGPEWIPNYQDMTWVLPNVDVNVNPQITVIPQITMPTVGGIQPVTVVSVTNPDATGLAQPEVVRRNEAGRGENSGGVTSSTRTPVDLYNFGNSGLYYPYN